MKKTRLKLFPPMLMLVAGSIASIMTYHFRYELKTALLVLLSVLLAFYILGLIFVNVVASFDAVNEAKEKAEKEAAMAEGLVVEKDDIQEGEMPEEKADQAV